MAMDVNKRTKVGLAAVALGGVIAASAAPWWGEPEPEPVEPARAALLPGDDVVLAYVGPQRLPVTQYDVQQAAERTLGNLAGVAVEAGTRGEMVDSVISTRAMAVLRESELTPTQAAELDKRVQAYRERLLVRDYLDAHAEPVTTSEEALRAYYDAHPEKFGPRPERHFELVYVELGRDSSARPGLLRALSEVTLAEDWRGAVAERQKKGLPVGFRRGDAGLANLPKRLRETALKLGVGEASTVVMVGDRAYALRMTKLGKKPGKTFEDVRERIAKLLEPRETRAQLQAVKDDVLEKVPVERVDTARLAESARGTQRPAKRG